MKKLDDPGWDNIRHSEITIMDAGFILRNALTSTALTHYFSWCEENCAGKYDALFNWTPTNKETFLFENSQDALLFALRFSDRLIEQRVVEALENDYS